MERQCSGPSAARLVTPTPPHDRPRKVCALPRDTIAHGARARVRTRHGTPLTPPRTQVVIPPPAPHAAPLVAYWGACPSGCACPCGGAAGGMTTTSHARGLVPPPRDGETRSRAGGARRAARCRAAQRVGALGPSCGSAARARGAQRQGEGGPRCSARRTVLGDTHQQMFVGTGGLWRPALPLLGKSGLCCLLKHQALRLRI